MPPKHSTSSLVSRVSPKQTEVEVLRGLDYESVKLEEVDMPVDFAAHVRFITPRFNVTLTYTGYEGEIQTLIRLGPDTRVSTETYALWQWLEAFGVSDPRAEGGGRMQTLEDIRESVTGTAEVLKAHVDRIANADRGVLERLQILVHQLWLEEQAQMAEDDHRSRAAAAGEAFHAKNYGRVVALLAPIESRLTRSESMKLAYARKHLAEGSQR